MKFYEKYEMEHLDLLIRILNDLFKEIVKNSQWSSFSRLDQAIEDVEAAVHILSLELEGKEGR